MFLLAVNTNLEVFLFSNHSFPPIILFIFLGMHFPKGGHDLVSPYVMPQLESFELFLGYFILLFKSIVVLRTSLWLKQ